MDNINLLSEDTIAAISSGISGGIGIIRVSGPEALSVSDRIFKAASGKSLSQLSSHTINYGHIVRNNTVTDEVLVSVMRAPRTYTGEDVVEINSHGGMFVMQKILELCLESGARLAEPGEFTKRAFLNGRIDLSQAEAVMDIINSDSDYALESSVSQLKGSVKAEIDSLREAVLYETAFIESAIDDPENYDIEGHIPELETKIREIKKKAEQLSATFNEGRLIKDGISTVILGRPNVGKSSLLNALSGYDKAIVTEIPGTTRDVLEERISLGDVVLCITDTAGIRDTDDPVESIGVEKARSAAKNADLILYMAEASVGINDEDKEIIDSLKGRNLIILLNKTDLMEDPAPEDDPDVIMLSVKTGDGIDALKEKIRELCFSGEVKPNEQVYITNIRHRNLLNKAAESLGLVLSGIAEGVSEDFLTIDMMDAYSYLGMITGQETGEDLVNEIFSKFCMGK